MISPNSPDEKEEEVKKNGEGWDVLREDMLTGAKMKDWDKLDGGNTSKGKKSSERGMEDPEEDPTIQCQTVCQFVRPNAMSNENLEESEETETQTGGLTADEAELAGEGMER